MENNKLIRLPDVVKKTGIPRSTIYALIKKSLFPKQINLSQRSVAWLESDIEAWVENAVSKVNETQGVK